MRRGAEVRITRLKIDELKAAIIVSCNTMANLHYSEVPGFSRPFKRVKYEDATLVVATSPLQLNDVISFRHRLQPEIAIAPNTRIKIECGASRSLGAGLYPEINAPLLPQ